MHIKAPQVRRVHWLSCPCDLGAPSTSGLWNQEKVSDVPVSRSQFRGQRLSGRRGHIDLDRGVPEELALPSNGSDASIR